MMELETEGKLSPEQIIKRLGTPKELAGAGILLFVTGWGLWMLTIKFVRMISRGRFQKGVIK